jgi:hypothetical protein
MRMKLKTQRRQTVGLDFADRGRKGGIVARDLSCVAQVGGNLWLGSDESVSVERLSWDAKHKRFGRHTAFDLTDFFTLPAGKHEEVDVEGLAVAPPYLWITGSHSLTRRRAEGRSFDEAIAELTQIQRQTNRYFLARVPLVGSAKDPGEVELCASAFDPEKPKRALAPARLFGTGATSVLTEALRFDELLRNYVDLPGKDNGLDVEGLAVAGDRVFLGLRGPVLRGWAVMLELEPDFFADGFFTLKEIGKKGRLYRRHFFDLNGLGIRDLQLVDDDLLILAGPTMDIDGRVLLLRWKKYEKRDRETVVSRDDLEVLLDFGGGEMGQHGRNHAEGVTVFTPPPGCDLPGGILVVYDAPAGKYVLGDAQVRADLFPFG